MKSLKEIKKIKIEDFVKSFFVGRDCYFENDDKITLKQPIMMVDLKLNNLFFPGAYAKLEIYKKTKHLLVWVLVDKGEPTKIIENLFE